MAPQNVGPLYLLPPLLITSRSAHFFTTPLLIVSRHYVHWELRFFLARKELGTLSPIIFRKCRRLRP